MWVPEGRNGAVLLAIIISLKWAWKLLWKTTLHRNLMLFLLFASSSVSSPWIHSLPVGRHHPTRTEEQARACGCLWNCSARGHKVRSQGGPEASHRGEKPSQGQHCISLLAFHPTGAVSHLWMLVFPCFLQNWTELTVFHGVTEGKHAPLHHQDHVYLVVKITHPKWIFENVIMEQLNFWQTLLFSFDLCTCTVRSEKCVTVSTTSPVSQGNWMCRIKPSEIFALQSPGKTFEERKCLFSLLGGPQLVSAALLKLVIYANIQTSKLQVLMQRAALKCRMEENVSRSLKDSYHKKVVQGSILLFYSSFFCSLPMISQ